MIYVLSTAITELSKAMIHLAKLVQDLLNCTVGCGSGLLVCREGLYASGGVAALSRSSEWNAEPR